MRILSVVAIFAVIMAPCAALCAPAMMQIASGQAGEPPAPVTTDFTADANCIGAWLMNGDSTDEADVSGNSATLTLTGTSARSAETPAGYTGYSRELPSYSGYFTHADGLSTDISGADQEITIAAWIRPANMGTDRYIASKGAVSSDMSWWIKIEDSTTTIIAAFSASGTLSATAETAATMTSDVWTHVAVVYDDTDIRIYIDGALDSNGASNPAAYTGGLNDSTTGFGVGKTGSNYFSGDIDELIVLSRALSASEVAEIYNNGIDGGNGAND